MGRKFIYTILALLAVSCILISGCTQNGDSDKSAEIAKDGDTVFVNYTGTLDNGSVFDSSTAHNTPFEFTIGSGKAIPGFDKGVIGMEVGEKKTIHIPVEDAYGPHSDELVMTVGRERFDENTTLEEGMFISISTPDGRQYPATITSLTDSNVTIDANHPQAGKDLNFELELVAIR